MTMKLVEAKIYIQSEMCELVICQPTSEDVVGEFDFADTLKFPCGVLQ